MHRILACIPIIVVMFASCVEPPDFSVTPEITYIRFDTTIVQAGENFKIFIDFQDGDGDIGVDNSDGSPSVDNLFRVDNRSGFLVTHIVPFLPPNGNIEAISGTIELEVQTFCIPINQTGTDTVSYALKLVDRAGNESLEVNSPDLIINCQ